MSYGFQTTNSSGTLNVDQDSKCFVYLGKYFATPIDAPDIYNINVTCVGFPVLYIDVPYNLTGVFETTSTGLNSFSNRVGIAVIKVSPNGTNTWQVTISKTSMNQNNDFRGFLYLRVFGRLDLNYPNGSGAAYGMQVFNPQGQIVFDSNLRMLRLAGNTYDTEITLNWQYPDGVNSPSNQYDTSVSLPFNMANKAICVGVRGELHVPYYTGSYVDFDTGQTIDQYTTQHYQTLYWANGNSLYARRIAARTTYEEHIGAFLIDNSKCRNVYSRLSVIDTTKFP